MPFGARFLLWVLPWVPVVAGCDPAPDLEWPDEAPFLERDSADVLVATTPGARARTPVGWVVDAEPEYQLGEVEGEEPYLFARIQGVRQLSYGRVAVLDGESCELRFFGPDGIFLNRDGIRLSFFEDRGRFSHRMRVSWHSARVPRVHGVPSPKDLPSLVEFQLHHLEMPDTTRSRLLEVRRRRYEEMPLPEIMPVFSRIGQDFVLGVWQDEFGVDYLRRHAVAGRR